MQTDKLNGHVAAPATSSLQNDTQRALEQRCLDPAIRCSATHPTLAHVHPVILLAVLNDIRDRNTQENRDFLTRLAADAAVNGIRQPIMVYREGDRLRVIDGETRRLAAMLAGLESVPVLIYEEKPNDGDMKLGQLLLNAMRKDMDPLELASVYSDLLWINGWSQSQLALAINVSAGQVARTLAISGRAAPEVQELVAARRLAPRAAYAISRLPMPQQIELARKAAELPMAVESVEEAVKKLLGNGRKAKDKPLKFSACGISGVIKGEPVATLKAFITKGIEVLKRIERDPALADVLPSLLKG